LPADPTSLCRQGVERGKHLVDVRRIGPQRKLRRNTVLQEQRTYRPVVTSRSGKYCRNCLELAEKPPGVGGFDLSLSHIVDRTPPFPVASCDPLQARLRRPVSERSAGAFFSRMRRPREHCRIVSIISISFTAGNAVVLFAMELACVSNDALECARSRTRYRPPRLGSLPELRLCRAALPPSPLWASALVEAGSVVASISPAARGGVDTPLRIHTGGVSHARDPAYSGAFCLQKFDRSLAVRSGKALNLPYAGFESASQRIRFAVHSAGEIVLGARASARAVPLR
jgi:hypothetical protein